MRCFFMRDGRISAVQILKPDSDEGAIAQGMELFDTWHRERFDGFEIWEQARFIYRYPPDNVGPKFKL